MPAIMRYLEDRIVSGVRTLRSLGDSFDLLPLSLLRGKPPRTVDWNCEPRLLSDTVLPAVALSMPANFTVV